MNTVSNCTAEELGAEERQYRNFIAFVQETVSKNLQEHGPNIFTTDAGNVYSLYDAYLDKIPSILQDIHDCDTCKRFVEKYGGLVVISKAGKQIPLLWRPNKELRPYHKPIKALYKAVKSASITGIFYPEYLIWGEHTSGGWEHLYVGVIAKGVKKFRDVDSRIKASLEKKQDYDMLSRSIFEYGMSTAIKAFDTVSMCLLNRVEKVKKHAEWFFDVCKRVHSFSSHPEYFVQKNTIIWSAVAAAPPGFCHIKSTMLGTLLDDFRQGYSVEDVAARFNAKMNPTQYQRPQALPKQGNVNRAEKLIQGLELEKSLERRFAGIEEVNKIWEPKHQQSRKTAKSDVFSSLEVQQKNIQYIPSLTYITFASFSRDIMPRASSIELYTGASNSYAAILTASYADSPPILQWDNTPRNPFSWYTYQHLTSGWNVPQYEYVEVLGVSLKPSMWYNPERYEHQGVGAFFLLKGCQDTQYKRAGLGLFPEFLKNNLREVKQTIEAYSNKGLLWMPSFVKNLACGVLFSGNHSVGVRVTSGNNVRLFKIDRWD